MQSSLLSSDLLYLIVALLITLIIHELAHAWTANRLGDPTARLMGRITLNPLAHIDPLGTIILPLLLILAKSPLLFGWAKPVQFDPYNLKNPRRDSAIISIAGPLSNLIVALIASILIRIGISQFSPFLLLVPFLIILTETSIFIALFNLIPVHPLDGGKILVGILPEKDSRKVDMFLRRYGVFILIFLIFPFGGSSTIAAIISPIMGVILRILFIGTPLV
jgi:Zn-dependent protease